MLLAQDVKPQADAANAPDNKAGAYYHFAMARLYAGLAANEGNKHDYVAKAIDHYKEALKADPSQSLILEELTDIYIQTGQLQSAIDQAEELLKKNPDNLDARRMLGRVYVRTLGNSSSRIDSNTLKQAIEQYQFITTKDAKDAESWVMLGRLYRFSQDSPNAEKAFDNALKADPDNEDAQTQLAMLYAELGDSKKAIEKLQAANKNPNERTLQLLAEQYEQLHDYKSAAEALKKAMELAPDDGKIARELAQDLMFSDQLDEALKLLQELAADEPRDPQLPISIAQVYRAKHDFVKAHEELNKAKSLDPGSMEVRYQEVKLLEAEGKLDEAISGLKTLLDDTARRTYSENSAGRRAGLLEEYGVLLRNTEKYPQAIEAFRQMNSLGTESAQQAAVQVIETYRESKDYDNALKEADAAVKKYPTDKRMVVEHANILADVGKVDGGVDELRKLGGDEVKTQISIAQLYEKGKRWTEMGKALDQAEKAAKNQDDKETIYFLRGAMLERQKKFDLSENEFRKVLELNPDNASALNYLGYMLADRSVRLDEAHRMIQKALELDPENGAYLDSMGWVLYRQSKLSEAVEMLQRAVDKMGKDPTIHDHLGDVYLKMGKTRDAVTQWQVSLKAYESGPKSDADPEDVAKVTRKLDDARVKLAQETKGKK
jgi:tetratricopeptide (TPR) repeat protein